MSNNDMGSAYSAVCGFLDILGQKDELKLGFEDRPLTDALVSDPEFNARLVA